MKIFNKVTVYCGEHTMAYLKHTLVQEIAKPLLILSPLLRKASSFTGSLSVEETERYHIQQYLRLYH